MSVKGYVWYSGASDVSGAALAEALGFGHGKKTPELEGLSVLLAWGSKAEKRKNYSAEGMKSKVVQGSLRILNHPNDVSTARNKLGLLQRLKEFGVSVPGFVNVKGKPAASARKILEAAIDRGELTLPCLGFNEHHSGNPVFCWTKEDVAKAHLSQRKGKGVLNLDYFRSLLQGVEYRIHVFRDEALCAERKVLSEDPLASTADSLMKKLTKRAKKNDLPLHVEAGELKYVIEQLAGDLMKGPSQMQKSTQHGWELTNCALGDVPPEVVLAGIEGLEAAGLDVGAVSVVLEENTALVTNIVAAPGLNDAQLELYVGAIKEFAGCDVVPGKKVIKKEGAEEAGVDPSTLEKLTRKIRLGRISQKKAEEMLANLEA